MGKGSEKTFLQRRYPKPPKEYKCSVLLIREIQIKTTIQYNLTSIRMATIKKKKKKISTGEDVDKLVLLVRM